MSARDPSETRAAPTSLMRVLGADCARMVALTLVGCAALVIFEYVATLWTSPAPDIRVVTALRLVLVEVTLIGLLWAVILVPAAIALALGARLAMRVLGRDGASDGAGAGDRDGASDGGATPWPGLWAPRRAPELAGDLPGELASGLAGELSRDVAGRHARAAWLWAAFLASAAYVAASAYLTLRAITHFKEPAVTALLLAVLQLGLLVCAGVLALCAARAVEFLARVLEPRLGRYSPLGRLGPAGLVVGALVLVGLEVVIRTMPQLAPLVPWRHLLALGFLALGMWFGFWLLARRGRLLPADRKRRRVTVAAGALTAVLLVPLTLVYVGADHETKSVAITGSPLMQSMVDAVRDATDFDDDGYGFLLGENDCDPFAGHIHPLARDIPDNGLDEDCNGRDFSMSMLRAHKRGDSVKLPEAFQRDWNFLLLTVDTVRYDHTGFGGYREAKDRDTTPLLDELVQRSVSFDFAQAPSAGTMASIPAILTSKFFHSGIALELTGVKPRMPPRMRPENLMLAEVLHEQGYYSGAIVSHQYFNDWGMEQGFDTYDNEIGKDYEPQRVTSHELTDKALAWVARNHRHDKWFLWVHYLDPHGRYVEHPGEPSFGSTEEDLYDGELRYTDKHIGRLLKELSQIPGADRTIVIITSDHGDAFNEHGFINHGQALYRELLHVPLIFYIPELPPRRVGGAVSPLDVFPTMAAFAGVDVSDLSVEGESLVPQLLYGEEDLERVVFSETNWPKPLRAAVSVHYKLIYKLQANVYEFYDLVADPWEKRNIYNNADKQALGHMKEQLDAWLERVYYARDPVMNQAAGEMDKYLVRDNTRPQVTPGQVVSFDEGRVRVLGFDSTQPSYEAGEDAEIAVYFEVAERPSGDFRLQVEAWPVTGPVPGPGPASVPGAGPGAGPASVPAPAPAAVTPSTAKSKLRATASGLFPTSRWRAGEIVRDTFKIKLPKTWTAGARLVVGLRVYDPEKRVNLPMSGSTRAGDKHLAMLGELVFRPAPATPGVTPGTPGVKPTGVKPPAVKPGGKPVKPTPGTPKPGAKPAIPRQPVTAPSQPPAGKPPASLR